MTCDPRDAAKIVDQFDPWSSTSFLDPLTYCLGQCTSTRSRTSNCSDWSRLLTRRCSGLACPRDPILRYVDLTVRIFRGQVIGAEVSPAGYIVTVEVNGNTGRREDAVLLTGEHRDVLGTNPYPVNWLLIVEWQPLNACCSTESTHTLMLIGVARYGALGQVPLDFHCLFFRSPQRLKVKGPSIYIGHTATCNETRTAAVYNSKWRTDRR